MRASLAAQIRSCLFPALGLTSAKTRYNFHHKPTSRKRVPSEVKPPTPFSFVHYLSFSANYSFSVIFFSTPRGVSFSHEPPHRQRPNRCWTMVREVGFEPTNPYGTGASGLRVQDPYPRVSLTWLGNTSRPARADSRKPPGPLPQQQAPKTRP